MIDMQAMLATVQEFEAAEKSPVAMRRLFLKYAAKLVNEVGHREQNICLVIEALESVINGMVEDGPVALRLVNGAEIAVVDKALAELEGGAT